MSTLYENIKGLCDSKGVTGAEMCRSINSSKSLMTNLKLGKTKSITGDTAQKIAEYFGVTVDRVLGNEGPEEQKENPAPTDGDGRSAKEIALEKVEEIAALGDEKALWEIFERISQKMQKK